MHVALFLGQNQCGIVRHRAGRVWQGIHPDVRPNDPVASDLFKRLSIAYNEGNEVELIKIADEIEKHVDNK